MGVATEGSEAAKCVLGVVYRKLAIEKVFNFWYNKMKL